MSDLLLRDLTARELTLELFSGFDRYQRVEQCWRKSDGRWVLLDIPFEERWGPEEFRILISCLRNTLGTGGSVFAAFGGSGLVGFGSVESGFFGESAEYLQLSSLHVSYGERGKGLGGRLFEYACKEARRMGAKKLYISSHSSKETQAFYRAMGCREALFINEALLELEPFDCQLEYDLCGKA